MHSAQSSRAAAAREPATAAAVARVDAELAGVGAGAGAPPGSRESRVSGTSTLSMM